MRGLLDTRCCLPCALLCYRITVTMKITQDISKMTQITVTFLARIHSNPLSHNSIYFGKTVPPSAVHPAAVFVRRWVPPTGARRGIQSTNKDHHPSPRLENLTLPSADLSLEQWEPACDKATACSPAGSPRHATREGGGEGCGRLTGGWVV